MSRSRRKYPVTGTTTSRSEKQDKRIANRKLRRAVHDSLGKGAEVLPTLREVSNVWAFAKDGRTRFDPKENPKGMRK